MIHQIMSCPAAFGMGLAGHFMFDILAYAAFLFFGVKIGHHCKHTHHGDEK